MDCAYCNRSTEGCASIKCSLCASQFHLECVSSAQLLPSGNSWRCCKCQACAAAPALVDTEGAKVSAKLKAVPDGEVLWTHSAPSIGN